MTLLQAWPGGVVATLALVLSGCSAESTEPESPDSTPRASTAPEPEPSESRGGPAPTTRNEEADVQIQITVGDQRFTAELDESAASRDLVAQLPVTLQMRDHGSVEKTGRLSSPLSLSGQPRGADPDIGDVGYYAPGQDLVLYYGDQSYFDGIVVLGRMEDGAASRLSSLAGTVTVTVSAA